MADEKIMNEAVNNDDNAALLRKENRFREAWDTLRQSKTAMIGLFVIVLLVILAIFGKWIEPYDPLIGELSEVRIPPCAAHWFGTDDLGRDILSRLIEGTKISLRVGFLAVVFALIFGSILGTVAAYYGKKVDIVIMRVMDVMMAIPDILLAIAIMSVLGRSIDNAIIAIGFASIPSYARIIRGSILSEKENDYVAAAKVVGNSDNRVMFVHILPNVISPIIIRSTLGISNAILEAAALGFLGLGVQPPYAEWGTMLSDAQNLIFNAPYVAVFPGVAITITVMAFNLLGDGLRDALDPRSRR